jgi:hypothetical protein
MYHPDQSYGLEQDYEVMTEKAKAVNEAFAELKTGMFHSGIYKGLLMCSEAEDRIRSKGVAGANHQGTPLHHRIELISCRNIPIIMHNASSYMCHCPVSGRGTWALRSVLMFAVTK